MNVLPEGIRDVSAQLGENSVGREWRKEVKENYVPRISYGDKNRLFIDKLN